MYISIFVFKKLSFNKKNELHSWSFFFERAYLHWTLQFKFLCWKDPNSLNSPVFFERTQLHFTELPSWSFFFGRTSLHWTPQFKISFGSTSLHWTPQLKFFWKYFTSLNSPVEVFLEWFHFTELPSWSFFGMISLYWTPQLKFFWNDFTQLNSPV